MSNDNITILLGIYTYIYTYTIRMERVTLPPHVTMCQQYTRHVYTMYLFYYLLLYDSCWTQAAFQFIITIHGCDYEYD